MQVKKLRLYLLTAREIRGPSGKTYTERRALPFDVSDQLANFPAIDVGDIAVAIAVASDGADQVAVWSDGEFPWSRVGTKEAMGREAVLWTDRDFGIAHPDPPASNRPA